MALPPLSAMISSRVYRLCSPILGSFFIYFVISISLRAKSRASMYGCMTAEFGTLFNRSNSACHVCFCWNLSRSRNICSCLLWDSCVRHALFRREAAILSSSPRFCMAVYSCLLGNLSGSGGRLPSFLVKLASARSIVIYISQRFTF